MAYYDDLKGYHELHKEEQLRKMELISSYLGVKDSDYLLDVGCGSGLSLDYFTCKRIGIDPSEELLKRCKSPTVKGTAEDLPFKDKEFDVVVCVSAIHNFKDPEKAVNEMKRVGKKRFAVTVFKKGSDKEKVLKIAKLIENNFIVKTMIDDMHDYIFICEK